MVSPWQLPLPLEEYAKNRVVVYFYGNRWIPIKYCFLQKAIDLYQKTLLLSGREILLFPIDLDPNSFESATLLKDVTASLQEHAQGEEASTFNASSLL